VGSCTVLRRTLFEQTPLGAGRSTFIHPSSKQATIAKQSKAKHSTAQHNTTQQTWGNLLVNCTVCTLLDALVADS
jgi:hypothetical protein